VRRRKCCTCRPLCGTKRRRWRTPRSWMCSARRAKDWLDKTDEYLRR
jgi:hypothetical protein